MSTMRRLALFLVAAASLGTAPAQAEPRDATFQKQVFGRALSGSEAHACFRRVYDTAHLGKHPDQNVRAMLLLVTGREEEGSATYQLSMGVQFRKNPARFSTSGYCGSIADPGQGDDAKVTVHCGIDCDGGQIDVALRDANSVRVMIPNHARFDSDAAGPDDEPSDATAGLFGADDKLFRLDRAALTDCLPVTPDSEVQAALRAGR